MSPSNATPLPPLQPALQFDPQLLLLAQPVKHLWQADFQGIDIPGRNAQKGRLQRHDT